MNRRILKLMDRLRAEMNKPEAYAYLPEIIESLEDIGNNLDLPEKDRRGKNGALGYIVLDNYAFAESSLGQEICDVLTDYVEGKLTDDVA